MNLGPFWFDFDTKRKALEEFCSHLEPSDLGPPRKISRAERMASLKCETNIEYICGKPGGGKSMFATKMVVDELIHGHRPIVTNLALNFTMLQEYLFSLGSTVCVIDRVRILKHEEVYQFFLYRGLSLVLPAPPDGAGMIDFEPSQVDPDAAGGVFYVIDECHNYFSTSSKVIETSPVMLWASQHRKLKDFCYFATQSIENVHAKIRRLGQQFNYIRNLRKETIRGFRRGDGFQRVTYLSVPTAEDTPAIHKESFSLDVTGLGSCYFTAAGVGIKGLGVADGGFQKKGMHAGWLYVFGAAAVVAILCVFFVLPSLGAAAADRALSKKEEKPAQPGQTVDAPAAGAPGRDVDQASKRSRPLLWVRSLSVVGRSVRVDLSDGRLLYDTDPELQEVRRDYVVVSGERLRFKSDLPPEWFKEDSERKTPAAPSVDRAAGV